MRVNIYELNMLLFTYPVGGLEDIAVIMMRKS